MSLDLLSVRTRAAAFIGSRASDPVATASWLLRAAVLLHAIGTFAIVFSARQTQFGNLLFLEIFDYRFPAEDPYLAAVFVEKIAVSIFLAVAVAIFLRPWWPLLLFAAAYALTEAVSGVIGAGYRFSEWTVQTNALRWGAPLALLVLVMFPSAALVERWRIAAAAGVLRVLVAVVFIYHGVQALMKDPAFIDLIIGTARRMLDVRVTEASAVSALQVIGVVDLAVAIAVLVYPTPLLVPRRLWPSPCAVCPIRRVIVPAVFGWAAFWGLVTAASRMTTLGWAGLSQYPHFFDRASHFLGPLALWCLFTATYRPAAACGRTAPDADGRGLVLPAEGSEPVVERDAVPRSGARA